MREKESASSRHKYTKIFTAKDHAKVEKYATEYGNTKAQRHFRELNLSEDIVCLFKNRYLNELAQHAKAGDSTEMMQLNITKCGHKLALNEMLDSEISVYEKMGLLSASLLLRLPLRSTNTQWRSYSPCRIWRSCPYHLGLEQVFRWALCRRKLKLKANVQLPGDGFKQIKASFLSKIIALVKAHLIPPELLINLDKTGII